MTLPDDLILVRCEYIGVYDKLYDIYYFLYRFEKISGGE